MEDTIYIALKDKTFTHCDGFVVRDNYFSLTIDTGDEMDYQCIDISRVDRVYAGYYAHRYLEYLGYKYVPYEDMVYDLPIQ